MVTEPLEHPVNEALMLGLPDRVLVWSNTIMLNTTCTMHACTLFYSDLNRHRFHVPIRACTSIILP